MSLNLKKHGRIGSNKKMKESIEDTVQRALLNKDYPVDLIDELWIDLDSEGQLCALNIMIESHREIFNDKLINESYEIKDIFEYLILNNDEFQNDYFNELVCKWMENSQ